MKALSLNRTPEWLRVGLPSQSVKFKQGVLPNPGKVASKVYIPQSNRTVQRLKGMEIRYRSNFLF